MSALGPEYDEEAIAAARHAVELDPAEPLYWAELGGICLAAGEYDEAISASRTAIDLDPRFSVAYTNVGVALTNLGRHEEALEAHMQAQALSPHPVYLGKLGAAHASLGNIEEAERILAELTEMAQRRYVGPRAFTPLYFALGRHDDAIAELIRCAEVRAPGANIWEIRNEFYDPLRTHPRYPELVRAMKLEW
jgi:tetratricopeptide (TPR) repeat protein